MELQNPEKTKQPYVFEPEPIFEAKLIDRAIRDLQEFKNEMERCIKSNDIEGEIKKLDDKCLVNYFEMMYKNACWVYDNLYHKGQLHYTGCTFLNDRLCKLIEKTAKTDDERIVSKIDNLLCKLQNRPTGTITMNEHILTTHLHDFAKSSRFNKPKEFNVLWGELSKIIDECVAELQQRLSLAIEKLNA